MTQITTILKLPEDFVNHNTLCTEKALTQVSHSEIKHNCKSLSLSLNSENNHISLTSTKQS